MEFAVHQPLKIYSGGLGFLSGSHLRSAYELRQNLVGVGILWKYGYYDQARNQDQTLQATERPLYETLQLPPEEEALLAATPRYLNSRAFTIMGGTTEIQTNILAKTWLGL